MSLEAFIHRRAAGALRKRRAIAHAAAACVLVGLGIASASMTETVEPPTPKDPEPVDVTLEEKIEDEKPKEEEPPPPSPEPAVLAPKQIKVKTEPPPPPPPKPDPDAKANLEESDPSKDVGAHGGGDGGGGTGKGDVKCGAEGQTCCASSTCTDGLECSAANVCRRPPPPCGGEGQACCGSTCNGALVCNASALCAKPAPKAAPAGPQLVSENDTPAKAISTPPPAYPAAARAAGITGAVVVRVTIDESGNVVDAKIVKGDPNFDAVVLPAVKSWKYEPARHEDGRPFLSTKVVKIPFKIKS